MDFIGGIGIIVMLIILYYIFFIKPEMKQTKKNEDTYNDDTMTFEEIEQKMYELYDEYEKQSINLTSVQLDKFNTQFEKYHNVSVTYERIYPFYINKTLIIDDICEVRDVSKNLDLYHINCDVIGFDVSLNSGAEKLNKGQKIRIRGPVNARLTYYEGSVSVYIFSTKMCTIKFNKVK